MSMATKAEERAALEKIRKIVEGLGAGSYVGTAFEGCLEDADQNIEYDFGCSMAQRAKDAQDRADKAEKISDEACKALIAEKDRAAALEEELDDARGAAKALDESLALQIARTAREQRRAEAAERQVIELKAKLYDFMTGQTEATA